MFFSFLSFSPLTLKALGTCVETCRSEFNRVNTIQENIGKRF